LKRANKPGDRAIGVNPNHELSVPREKSSYRSCETNEMFNIRAVHELDTGYKPLEKSRPENEWICARGGHTPEADAAIFRMRQQQVPFERSKWRGWNFIDPHDFSLIISGRKLQRWHTDKLSAAVPGESLYFDVGKRGVCLR
jgi:hypothetical protein